MKLLPSSVESEQAVLCACLLRPEIIPQLRQQIHSVDFYREAHSLIFDAFCALGDRTELASVGEWLQSRGMLEKVGSHAYLMELDDYVSTSAGWRYHVEIIKDRATRRRLIHNCARAAESAYDLTNDPAETLSTLKGDLRGMDSDNGVDESTAQVCLSIQRDIERRSETKNPYSGIKVGLENIDTKAWGLEPGTTTYLIARPSMGKTALSLNIAEHVSKHYLGPVLFFSLESSAKALVRRLLSSHSTVYLSRLRTADLDDSQWPLLMDSYQEVSDNERLQIIAHPRYKQVETMIAKCETVAMGSPISLIVIDHIQRMSTGVKKQNRHLELSYISELLTTLSQNLKVPMIILSQLKRGVEGRKDPRPDLSDMRESGDLEQNADQVWGLYRKDREDEIAQLNCLKGRDTGTWKAWLRFDMRIQRFYDGEEPEKQTVREETYMDK